MVLLAQPCRGGPTTAGRTALKRLEKGFHPAHPQYLRVALSGVACRLPDTGAIAMPDACASGGSAPSDNHNRALCQRERMPYADAEQLVRGGYALQPLPIVNPTPWYEWMASEAVVDSDHDGSPFTDPAGSDDLYSSGWCALELG